MADLSKVKIGESTYNLKDAQARTDVATAQSAIAAEAKTRADADTGLDTRIKALESKGRFLSTWNAETGKPDTYPELAQLEEGKYNYRSGDYYIVNKVVATAANNKMPDGAYITYDSATTTWTVPTTAFTGTTLNLGDQFQYDGTKWTHIASATTVAFANIQGDAEENTNLKGKLDAKLAHKSGKTGTAGDLAYKDSASASYTPAGTISEVNATPEGSVTVVLNDASAATEAVLTKADFKPAGTILVDGEAQATGNKAIKGGSIEVTIKDAATATAVTDLTYDDYTPVGTIAPTPDVAATKVLTNAIFSKSSSATTGAVKIEGTVSTPDITVDDSAVDTFVKSLKPGTVDAAGMDATKFSGGSFTGASKASFTQGSKASFTQGTKASFSKGAAVAAAIEGVTVAVDETDTEMLVFTAAATDNVIGHDEATFTANGDDTFTANGDDSFTANNIGTFTPASVSAGFVTSQKLPVVDATADAVTAVTATSSQPTFTGEYYINTLSDTDMYTSYKFTGTAAKIKLTGAKYLKQEINTATFAPVEATLTFEGTNVTNALVTKAEYKKQVVDSASFSGTENKITPTFSGTTDTITVE